MAKPNITPAGKGEIYRVQPWWHKAEQRKVDLESTVSKLITGTDELSEDQIREGRHSFSIVLSHRVRNPADWSSRERARATVLVARTFSFVLMNFFFILV